MPGRNRLSHALGRLVVRLAFDTRSLPSLSRESRASATDGLQHVLPSWRQRCCWRRAAPTPSQAQEHARRAWLARQSYTGQVHTIGSGIMR